MDTDRISLKLDGSVSMADFRTAVDALADLLNTLTAEVESEAAVEWQIDRLASGSALMVVRGVGGDNAEATRTVQSVTENYIRLAEDVHGGRLGDYAPRVQESMTRMMSIVNGRIPRIIMALPDVPDKSVAITSPRLLVPADAEETGGVLRIKARSSVKGQIVSLDDKNAIYFTLRPAYGMLNVRCYPTAEYASRIADAWKARPKPWVLVEGTYSRYAAVPTITDITDIRVLPAGEVGGWKNAVGAWPRGKNSSTITSAEAVRRVRERDAEEGHH